MLFVKFRGIRSTGSGEEDFLRVFTIYGRGSHLGHVTWTIYTNFGSPFQRRLHIKFGFDWPSGFREEDLWKWWTDRRWTDRRQLDVYTISSPCEPNGSGELIKSDIRIISHFFIQTIFILYSCKFRDLHKCVHIVLNRRIHMSLVLRKPVFGVSDQVPHKPGCTASENG